MRPTPQQPLVDVLDVQIAPFDLDQALQTLALALENHTRGYVCLTGVHGIMEAHRNPHLQDVFAGSLLSLPDGMPTVWLGHLFGHPRMQQVAGPDLMLALLASPLFANRTHFFYGGKPGVAKELEQSLQSRFPHLRSLGTFTPPFRPLAPAEEERLAANLNALHPDIVWVGISTPRQEQFMHRMSPLLNATLMFGVGAAFDFHTGRIQDSPRWVKRAGLQWLDRLRQDPRHLWRRYLRNNPAFLWHILLQLTGLRTYPHAPAAPSTHLQNIGPTP